MKCPDDLERNPEDCVFNLDGECRFSYFMERKCGEQGKVRDDRLKRLETDGEAVQQEIIEEVRSLRTRKGLSTERLDDIGKHLPFELKEEQ